MRRVALIKTSVLMGDKTPFIGKIQDKNLQTCVFNKVIFCGKKAAYMRIGLAKGRRWYMIDGTFFTDIWWVL